jgi:hypothetical protein
METEPALCPAIILSDSVIREHGAGKISLIGSFTTYNFPTFPFVAAPFIGDSSAGTLTHGLGPLQLGA